jgi:hypothetical protein
LENHILRTHEKVKNFVCEICGTRLLNLHNLKIHARKKHNGTPLDKQK